MNNLRPIQIENRLARNLSRRELAHQKSEEKAKLAAAMREAYEKFSAVWFWDSAMRKFVQTWVGEYPELRKLGIAVAVVRRTRNF
jgi:hypothetical protein